MSKRNLLLGLLENYRPFDECGATRIIDFVKNNPDCFLRSNLLGHVTGSCWLIDESGTEVLLTHHKKLQCWLQLGGHADGDADILQVAIREAKEESGIDAISPVFNNIFDIDIHTIPEHKGVPSHLHYDIRFALRAFSKDFVISDESNDLAWVKIRDIDHPTFDASLVRMAQKWSKTRREV